MPAGTSYTFKEGMLLPTIKKEVIEQETYYRIEVKNQFLHATHPLGWIRRIELEVGKKAVDPKTMYFVVRGQWFAASRIHTIEEVFWHLSEKAQIYFPAVEEPEAGAYHVKCTFVLSMLEDPQIIDKKNQWPERIEFVEGDLRMEVNGE